MPDNPNLSGRVRASGKAYNDTRKPLAVPRVIDVDRRAKHVLHGVNRHAKHEQGATQSHGGQGARGDVPDGEENTVIGC